MIQSPIQIGRYQILGVLGTGGMAEVLLARIVGPSGFERPVVIKRILPHLARQKHFVDMFLDEARIVAGIAHQNVVHVHELGRDGEELFLVMEYLEGESAAGLARRLSARRKLLSFGLCAHVIAEVAAGLHAAHNLKDTEGRDQNLVHRDVSPANLFVTYEGGVKILDFGIAVAADRVSRTDAGQVKGKYAYMSPEQCMGHPLDRRSDVFSLGTVLYELSTCRRLFKRSGDMLTLQAICNEDALPPSKLVTNYPPELERICLKALSRDRDQRYQSALDMRRDLLALSAELNQRKIPEESLAKVMHKLFPDRIDQKRSLLSHISSGRDITSVPEADTDMSVELPEVVPNEPESKSAISSIQETSQTDASPFSMRRAWLIGGLAAAAVVIFVTGALTMGGRGLADADIAAAPSVPLVLGAAVPTQAPVGETPSENVTVQFETDPAGARVYAGLRPVGETPLALQVARGSERVEFSIRLPGYRTVDEVVTPDVDQKLRLTMMREKGEASADPRARAAGTGAEVPSGPASLETVRAEVVAPDNVGGDPKGAPGITAPAVRPAAAGAQEKPKPEEEDPYRRFEDPYRRFN